MRTFLVAMLLTMLAGCASSPIGTVGEPGEERLRDAAAAHARSLAGDDRDAVLATGRSLIALLAARFGWATPASLSAGPADSREWVLVAWLDGLPRSIGVFATRLECEELRADYVWSKNIRGACGNFRIA